MDEEIGVNVYYLPPTEVQNAIRAAVGLWSGADYKDLEKNPEYWRGQIDLICDLAPWPGVNSEDKREAIEETIGALVYENRQRLGHV